MSSINGKKVALLVSDGFEESELKKPLEALKQAGATAVVVSPKEGEVRGWSHEGWGEPVQVDMLLDKAKPEEFSALVLPGGVINPDTLRMNDKAIQFIKHFVEEGKVVGAICHGPWTLIEAKAVNGLRMTSYQSIKTDLINAGAEWVDEEVVTDNGIVTSRNPNDLPAFCKKLIEEIGEGHHDRQGTSQEIHA